MKMFSDIMIEYHGESEIIRITLNMYLLSIKSFGVRTFLCQPVVNYLSQEHLWRLAGVQMTAVAIREN